VLWLPREVKVDIVYRGMEVHNTHHYSNFKLFRVESTIKAGGGNYYGLITRSLVQPGWFGDSADILPTRCRRYVVHLIIGHYTT
jgi:hypothetical protein